MTNSVK